MGYIKHKLITYNYKEINIFGYISYFKQRLNIHHNTYIHTYIKTYKRHKYIIHKHIIYYIL